MLTQHTFHFIGIGGHKHAFIKEGVSLYSFQLKKFCHVQWHLCKDAKKPSSEQQRLTQESLEVTKVLKKISSPQVILLQNGPKSPSSEQLAINLQGWMEHHKNLVFIIGGAWGLHSSLQESADVSLSLGPLTMNHQLVRLVLLEQLFRGLSIHFGMDYHH